MICSSRPLRRQRGRVDSAHRRRTLHGEETDGAGASTSNASSESSEPISIALRF